MLTASQVITLSDFNAAWRAHFRSRPLLRGIFAAAGCFVIIHSIHGFWTAGLKDVWSLLVGVLTLLFGFFLLFLPSATTAHETWRMRKNPVIGTEAKWTFTEDGYRYEGVHHRATADWRAFSATSSFPDCHLFYPQWNLFVWVPASAFAKPEDFEAVRELLRRNTKHRDFH